MQKRTPVIVFLKIILLTKVCCFSLFLYVHLLLLLYARKPQEFQKNQLNVNVVRGKQAPSFTFYKQTESHFQFVCFGLKINVCVTSELLPLFTYLTMIWLRLMQYSQLAYVLCLSINSFIRYVVNYYHWKHVDLSSVQLNTEYETFNAQCTPAKCVQITQLPAIVVLNGHYLFLYCVDGLSPVKLSFYLLIYTCDLLQRTPVAWQPTADSEAVRRRDGTHAGSQGPADRVPSLRVSRRRGSSWNQPVSQLLPPRSLLLGQWITS